MSKPASYTNRNVRGFWSVQEMNKIASTFWNICCTNSLLNKYGSGLCYTLSVSQADEIETVNAFTELTFHHTLAIRKHLDESISIMETGEEALCFQVNWLVVMRWIVIEVSELSYDYISHAQVVCCEGTQTITIKNLKESRTLYIASLIHWKTDLV